MNCHELRIQISGEMSGERKKATEQRLTSSLRLHLEQCPGCARYYREETHLDQMLEAAAAVSPNPPVDLWDRIEARLHAVPTPASVPAKANGREGFAERLAALFRVPAFRPVWVGLLLAGILTGGLTHLPTGDDSATLFAELDAFRLETPENPFFTVSVDESNPFEGGFANTTPLRSSTQ